MPMASPGLPWSTEIPTEACLAVVRNNIPPTEYGYPDLLLNEIRTSGLSPALDEWIVFCAPAGGTATISNPSCHRILKRVIPWQAALIFSRSCRGGSPH